MLHTIKSRQFIKSDLETVWNFISSPKNLSKITPDKMDFNILSEAEDLNTMYSGQIIEYTVSPVFNIKLHWVTEIKAVVDKSFFIDEQRVGPYSFWHHKHFIKEVDGGVEMTDVVHYKLPFGFLGKVVNALFVKKQLEDIFAYRFKKLEQLFNQ
jgi:ligand-binding SRPBCC domain-containing protein